MFGARDSHHVSVKVAIFSADLQRVLVMCYPRMNVFGLPGGHIDAGEDPDTALVRELKEELGVTLDHVTRKDFFFSKRIVLAYTAIVPNDFETYPTDSSYEYAVWREKSEIPLMDTLSKDYAKFILEHWPVA